MPVKQVMVKQVRDYRAKGYKQFSLLAEILQLKAAELSRFLSHISANFFYHPSEMNFSITFFFFPKSLLLLMTAVGLLLFRRITRKT